MIWANGEFVDADAARIGSDDRGFLLGDGVFDTFGVRGGAPAHLPAHLERLRTAADAFGVPLPFADDEIAAAAQELAQKNGVTRGAGRLTVSRGPGQRGLPPPDPARPFVTLMVAASPAPEPGHALRLTVSDVVRPSGALTSRHKTLSYIENVEARRRAATAGADEAMMLNERGEVACASAANLFWISGDELRTPALECGVLAGITRARVLALADEAGMATREGRWPPYALRRADAMFVTNSVLGVMPVASLAWGGAALKFDAENSALAALRAAEAA